MRARSTSEAPPRGRSAPVASRKRHPTARAAPVPPSVDCASPNARDNLFRRSTRDGLGDQAAGAEARCAHCAVRTRRNQGQARGGSHLDGRAPVGEECDGGSHRIAQRTKNLELFRATAQRDEAAPRTCPHRRRRADEDGRPPRENRSGPADHGFGCLGGGESPFELVRRNHDVQAPDSSAASVGIYDVGVPADLDVVIASNRGPVSFISTDDGFELKRGAGGLAGALDPVVRELGEHAVWIAAANSPADRAALAAGYTRELRAQLGYRVELLDIDEEVYARYYDVAANRMLWFANHCLWDELDIHEFGEKELSAWGDAYEPVNREVRESRGRAVELRHPGALAGLPPIDHRRIHPRAQGRPDDRALHAFVVLLFGSGAHPEPDTAASHRGDARGRPRRFPHHRLGAEFL